mmetsp:Transcript_14658/g.19304  ORF Transcript_14658/g.19304 Transcript_14658/m.19304 type:complete len:80 (-) Transcript_14658:64-303(-)
MQGSLELQSIIRTQIVKKGNKKIYCLIEEDESKSIQYDLEIQWCFEGMHIFSKNERVIFYFYFVYRYIMHNCEGTELLH